MTTPALSEGVTNAPQYPETDQPVSWTGLRLGIHAGLTRTSGDADLGDFEGNIITLDVYNGLFPSTISADKNSFSGGINGGYDYQKGNFVIGVAGDVTLSNVDVKNRFGRVDPSASSPFSGVDTNTVYSTKIDHLATARLRLGYAMDRTLVYVTGGVAVAEVENRFDLTIPQLSYNSPNWAEKNRETGYVVGVGVEHQITKNWRLSLELQKVDLGDVNVQGVDPANFPGQEINYKFSNELLLARFGLAYAF